MALGNPSCFVEAMFVKYSEFIRPLHRMLEKKPYAGFLIQRYAVAAKSLGVVIQILFF